MKEKNLFIGPHPDDVFIACAGYILKNSAHVNSDIVCVATESINPSKEIRMKEEQSAWSDLLKNNYELIFLEKFEDTRIHERSNVLIQEIEGLVSEREYSKIFIPYYDDTHQDHRTVSQCALSALRYQKNVIFYETPSSINFNPTIYADIPEEVLNKKCSVIENYNSQIIGRKSSNEIRLSEYTYTKMISNGLKSRTCNYAEGFAPFKYFF